MEKTNYYRTFFLSLCLAAAVPSALADPIQIGGDDGWYSAGDYFGDGVNPADVGGDSSSFMMWYPTKAAFRATLTIGSGGMDLSASNIGNASAAFGNGEAIGNVSFAMGNDADALGDHSTAFGHGIRADTRHVFAVGRFNKGGGNPSQWNEEDPLFEVGNGSSTEDRSNAVTIYKSGDVHVHDGAIRVQPAGDTGMGGFTSGTQPQ